MPNTITALPARPDTTVLDPVPADGQGWAETGAARVWRHAYHRVSHELSTARAEDLERSLAARRRLTDEISKGYERAADAYERGLNAGMKIADEAATKRAELL